MHSCSHHNTDVALLDLGEFSILNIFLLGLFGSLGHCVFMCGPIAITQSNIRLMSLKQNKCNQWSKGKAVFAMPYYIGKALAYCLLLILSWTLSSNVKDLIFAKYLGIAFLLMAAFSFFNNVITIPYLKNSLISSFIKKLAVFYSKKVKIDYSHPFGLRGLLLGFALGFIPCGLVYNTIITIIAATNNIFIALLSMIGFALATVPVLFVVALVGSISIKKLQKYVSKIYIVLSIFNGLFLLYQAKILWYL